GVVVIADGDDAIGTPAFDEVGDVAGGGGLSVGGEVADDGQPREEHAWFEGMDAGADQVGIAFEHDLRSRTVLVHGRASFTRVDRLLRATLKSSKCRSKGIIPISQEEQGFRRFSILPRSPN